MLAGVNPELRSGPSTGTVDLSRLEETRVLDPDTPDLDAAASGDLAAAGRLYSRHRGRVTGLARLLTGNRGDAEDVCHDAFLRAFSRLGDFRREVPFSVWLSRIAVNHCRHVLARTQTRRRFSVAQSSSGEVIAARPQPELQAALRQALARLTEAQREVFVCHDALGMGHQEIAFALGCAEGTSKVQLHRARLRLRSMLSGEEP